MGMMDDMLATTTATRVLDELFSEPDSWSRLTDRELAELLAWACTTYGSRTDRTRTVQLRQLYAHAVDALSPQKRADVVLGLMRPLEQLAREGQDTVHAMVPFLALDSDFVVISTATLQAAQLAAPTPDEPLTGPRAVLGLALEFGDPNIQVAMLSGLAALGDARVFELLDAQWHRVSHHAHIGLFASISMQRATVAGIDFLIGKLERSTGESRDRLAGPIVATLVRIAESAAPADSARPFTGTGVRDIARVFPSWAVPEGQNPVVVRATYTVAETGSWILPRLERLAADEGHPKLLPMAIRAWGP